MKSQQNEWNFTESTFQCFKYPENDFGIYSQWECNNVNSFLLCLLFRIVFISCKNQIP